MLFDSVEATQEETHAHDQEKIRKDTTDQRFLNDVDFVLSECDDGDDQFHGVAIPVQYLLLIRL